MLKLPKLNESYWQDSYPKSIDPEPLEDLSLDIVIVGSGITGLTYYPYRPRLITSIPRVVLENSKGNR